MFRVIGIAWVVILSIAGISRGDYTVTFSQVGPNVVATGTGTLNITGLTFLFGASGPPAVESSLGFEALGPSAPVGSGYGDITGPTSFGPGGDSAASTGSGDYVAVVGSQNLIIVPQGYISGTSLSDTATWDNTTIAGLSLTPGTYTWTWGSGPTQDSFVVEVPEPASLSAIAIGSVALLGRFRRVSR